MCLWCVLDVALAKLVSVVAIFALAGETFPGVSHSLDVWHKAKILGKKLSEVGCTGLGLACVSLAKIACSACI